MSAKSAPEPAPITKRPSLASIIRDGAARAKELNAVGMKVAVVMDSGVVLQTLIHTLPWQLGHGQWVVGVNGIGGGFDILRVTKL